MAQANFTPIQLYRSTTASAVPTSGNLADGELAINTNDGKLYYKDSGGTVQLIASKAGASGDVVGPASATDNAIVRFDGATGKLVQNSVVTIADSTGDVAGVGALTASGNLTLSGGTVNGVLYLNGTKVATSGSALTFDGTNFATTGTATATKLIPTGNVTAGNGMFLPTTNTLAWSTNGAEGMRLDSSGNLGLGVTPSAWNTNYKAVQVKGASLFQGASNSDASLSANNFVDAVGDKYINSDYASVYTQFQGQHIWKTAASGTAGNAITFTQAMTLDASGNLLVGTTSSLGGYKFQINGDLSSSYGQTVTSTQSSGFFINFSTSSGQCGYITGTGTSSSYVTSSDYRLKENIAPMTGALAKVAALKPCTYTWKADGSAGEGFIAHELQEVAPYAVSGEKDGEQMQGVDYGKITPLLTAALQETIAEIKSLKARVVELEAR